MTAASAFYRARAAQSLQDAQDSTLDNVRNRHLHSAAAWKAMADRAAKIETARLERSADVITRDDASIDPATADNV